MSTRTSRDRSVRVTCSVLPNSPRAYARWSRADHMSNLAHQRSLLGAHRHAHRHATALVTTGIGGLSLVAVSSAHGGGRRREATVDVTSNDDPTPRGTPGFWYLICHAIPRSVRGEFSKLGLAGCFL